MCIIKLKLSRRHAKKARVCGEIMHWKFIIRRQTMTHGPAFSHSRSWQRRKPASRARDPRARRLQRNLSPRRDGGLFEEPAQRARHCFERRRESASSTASRSTCRPRSVDSAFPFAAPTTTAPPPSPRTKRRAPRSASRVRLRQIPCRGQLERGELIADQWKKLRAQIGDKNVLLALSGGVDSIRRRGAARSSAVGKQLDVRPRQPRPVLREGEPEQVVEVFRHRA